MTFLGGHVIVPDLRTYQIRIPREILGLNDGLTFSLAQKKILFFWWRHLMTSSKGDDVIRWNFYIAYYTHMLKEYQIVKYQSHIS